MLTRSSLPDYSTLISTGLPWVNFRPRSITNCPCKSPVIKRGGQVSPASTTSELPSVSGFQFRGISGLTHLNQMSRLPLLPFVPIIPGDQEKQIFILPPLVLKQRFHSHCIFSLSTHFTWKSLLQVKKLAF